MSQARQKPRVANISSRKTTTITLPMDVYLEAKELGINISQVCEEKLGDEIQARKNQHWNERNAEFIAAYNDIVEAEGLALQEWRVF